ncbi:cysteine-rich receptor-like protein kinase 15 [Neltuma alba]|uniref:cysteine-rich receptor-like protein kinase 15 n=1 Tax=Neltuma alba TaxID=207710 RepID=UPI0010A3A396|nr:cysteine-rich receptor-like protein kinase 15 [Prosopis alba]
MVFFIIPILFLHLVSGSDPLSTWCPPEFPEYTLNSTFHNNLELLLGSLSSNISVSGFYNTSIGEEPDKVYGLALCRGDINSTTCKDCVEKASQDILNKCRIQDAIIWYDLCQVRYSFQMFISMMVYTGKYPDENNQAKDVADPARFSQVLMHLMNNLSNEAAFVPSKNMFASGEIKFFPRITIYGLVQCTRDISETLCYNCLSSAIGDLGACCSSHEGGIVLSRTCNVRFGLSQFFNTSSQYLVVYPNSKGGKWKTWMLVLIICAPLFLLALLTGFCVAYFHKKQREDRDDQKSEKMLLQQLGTPKSVTITQDGELISSEELEFMNFATIKIATDDFSDSNKLGQGGFGSVYKGVLPDGNEVAVKRLSRKSWQGTEEFKNEVILIAKLQHRNLVRLLGCGLEGEEKFLVYEYMSNQSLDRFIFDSEKRSQLDWNTCYGIIMGIARGLLYLHEESRLRIIHRDLKPNNVLLDHDMVAKISDFGMARIFYENQSTANTKRVVGTYGYMAPEYAMRGLFSAKSDIFSFGVILLEIISGKRSSGFYATELASTLLAYAWRLWNERKEMEFVDPHLMEASLSSEILRCMHIGLLCVQEDPEDRPTISDIMVLLGSEPVSLPKPKQPAFSVGKSVQVDPSLMTTSSVNHIMLSTVQPR